MLRTVFSIHSVTSALTVAMGAATGLPGRLEAQHPACLDRGGIPVVTVPSDSLPYAAWATLTEAGAPVIYWNAGRMVTTSPTARLMVYLHECAHHALGHVYKLPSNDVKQEYERQADCWAVQQMVEREVITTLALHQSFGEISRWSGDRTHRGGPDLVSSLGRCLSDKISAALWRQFLDALAFASADSLALIRGDLIPESGEEMIRESMVDAPGVSDCDIRGDHVLLCRLFQGIRPETVLRRYQETRALIQSWLSPSWTALEREQQGFPQTLVFLAWNDQTGANLSLVVTESHRLFFTWSALRP